MPPNNCDPAPRLLNADAESADIDEQHCPKCGAQMEPIDSNVEGLPLQHLQLCPGCYLVMWSDQHGIHVRQGVPMREGSGLVGDTTRLVGEPTEC